MFRWLTRDPMTLIVGNLKRLGHPYSAVLAKGVIKH